MSRDNADPLPPNYRTVLDVVEHLENGRGKQIVFEADDPQFPRGGAWLVSPDGTGFRNLTSQTTLRGVVDGFADPVWSPDGTVVLLTHGRFLDDGTSQVGLAMIRPDGSGLGNVSDGAGMEHQPDWTSAKSC